MKVEICFATILAATAWALPSYPKPGNDTWAPAGPGDERSPCPMLNSLANHGLINHNGKNITKDQISSALTKVLGFSEQIADFLFQAGMGTTKNPNGTSFDFSDVNQHDLLEHDGSLSRADFFFGNAVSFNPAAFAQTKSYFTKPTISLQQAANARLARMYTANATNPAFGLNPTGTFDSFGETILYMSVLGDPVKLTVSRSWVEYLFEKERLPYALGWKGKGMGGQTPLDATTILNAISAIQNATGGSFPLPRSLGEKRGVHF